MMKRMLAFVMLVALCGTGAWAQAVATDTVRAPSADTVRAAAPSTASGTVPSAAAADVDDEDDDDGENVIGGRVMRSQTGGAEANLIGSPVYYPANSFAARPAHHYLNSLDNNFSSVFLEVKLLAGRHDVGWGMQLAVVPKRWGGYGSALMGREHGYLSVGAVLRLSDYDSRGDWQLYGGMIAGCGVGAEGGLRWAMPREYSHRFCWASVSGGMAVMNGRPYFTCGLSLEVTAMTVLALLYW